MTWRALILAVLAACQPDGGKPGMPDDPAVTLDTDPVVAPADSDAPVDTGAPGDHLETLSARVWLDVADLALVDGGRVASWPAHGGASTGATQPLVERQPRVRLVDGAPRVRLDGVDDRLDLGAIPLGDAYTVVAVLASSSTEGAILGGEAPTLALDDGRPALRAGDVDLVADAALGDGLHVVVGVVADRTTTLYVDGIGVRTSIARPEVPDEALAIGAATGPRARDALSGDLVAFLLFDRALSGCDRLALERGLAALYGVYGVAITPSAPLPFAWWVADDLDDDGPVATWSARPTSALRAEASVGDEARRPSLDQLGTHRAVRFDGVDDRLDLNLAELTRTAPPPLSIAVVLSTSDPAGHLLGTGASVDGRLRTDGTGLVVDGGRALAKVVSDGQGLVVEGGPVDDGAPHVLLGELLSDRVGVAVDADEQRAAGAPTAVPFARVTLGASDGSAAGTSIDPLAARIADVRVWGGPLDACDRARLYAETLDAYGAPAGVAPAR